MDSFENALKESLTQLMDSNDLTVAESQEHTFSSEYEKNIADICKQYSLPASKFAQLKEKSPKIIVWRKIAIAICAAMVITTLIGAIAII